MQCPKCNVENDDKRASCWNCFTQLRPPEDAKPHKIEVKKEETAPAVEPEMEPVMAPADELESETGIGPAEEPETEAFLMPTTAADLNEMKGSPTSQHLEGFPSPADSKALDLDEPVDQFEYIVPGLAEPLPEIEPQAPAVAEEEPVAAAKDEVAIKPEDALPADDWLDLPEFNPDAIEDEPPAPVPVVEQASKKKKIKASANVKPAKEKAPGRKPNLLLPIIIIVLILAALAAWWFMFAYPSPEPVAKDFITAMNLTASGDSSKLKTICTASSQADIGSGAQALGKMKPQGLAMQMSAGKVDGVTVNGDQAEVKLNLSISFGTTQMQFNMPMRVALLREGPIFHRQWKVDLPATNRLGAEDAKQMVQKMFPGGMPRNIPMAAPPGAYPAPR